MVESDTTAYGGYAIAVDPVALKAYTFSATNQLVVLDIADPANLRYIGATSIGASAQIRRCKLSSDGQTLYVCHWDKFIIVDVSSPVSPSVLGSYTSAIYINNCTDFAVDETQDVVFLNADNPGITQLTSLDISTPASISRLQSIDLGFTPKSLDVDEAASVLVVGMPAGSTDAGIATVDVSNPSSMSGLGYVENTSNGNPDCIVLDAANSVAFSCNRVYDRVTAWSYATPATPSLLDDAFYSSADFSQIWYDSVGEVLYAAAENLGTIRAYDVSNPSSISTLGTLAITYDPWAIAGMIIAE